MCMYMKLFKTFVKYFLIFGNFLEKICKFIWYFGIFIEIYVNYMGFAISVWDLVSDHMYRFYDLLLWVFVLKNSRLFIVVLLSYKHNITISQWLGFAGFPITFILVAGVCVIMRVYVFYDRTQLLSYLFYFTFALLLFIFRLCFIYFSLFSSRLRFKCFICLVLVLLHLRFFSLSLCIIILFLYG